MGCHLKFPGPGLLGLLLMLSGAVAQSESGSRGNWFMRVWQTDDGLPGNDVSGVVQMPDGWLWVATQNGLARFDGIRFSEIPITLPSGRDQPLIRVLLRGQQQDLWLALEGALVARLGAQSTQVFTSSNGLPAFRPMSMAQTREGAVWVAYADGSVCRIIKDEVTRFTARDGLAGAGACGVANDSEGRLWFAKSGRVGIWESGQFTPLHTLAVAAETLRLATARDGGLWICAGLRLFKCAGPSHPPVEVAKIPTNRSGVEPAIVFEDREGLVWVGTTTGGLFVWGGDRWRKVRTSHEEILALAEDREGNLWVGTGGGGLDRLRPRLLDLQGVEDGLPLASIRSICEDRDGRLWAVAQSGELAWHQAGRWRALTTNDGWSGLRANCVLADRDGGVWIGTYRAGLHRWQDGRLSSWQRQDGLGGDVIRGLFQDSHGALWIALEANVGLQRLRDGQFQTFVQPSNSRAIRALAEDAQGQMWFGTMDGFLLRAEEDRLVNETPRTLASPRAIRCLVAPPDGSVWIGYAGAGLGRWRNGEFKHIGSKHGLPDDYICAMTPDDGGGWWFAADRGLFQVRHRELEAVASGGAGALRAVLYGRDEALPNLQANYGYAPGSTRSRDGRIWFPMRTGLLVVHPERTPRNRIPPPVLIEQLTLDGKVVLLDSDQRLRLPPGHRKLEVDYTAFSFTAPESVTFRTWLEGWDDNWVENGTLRRLSYTRLPAGTYRLRVTARGSAGDWNPVEATLPFVVKPFPWQTWWFRGGVLVLFTAGVVAVVRYVSHRRLRARLWRLEQEALLQKERARIAKDIHDDLGASLTQISLLGRLAEHDLQSPEKTGPHLKQISQAAREGVKAVDEIVWAVNPRNDTVAHLLDYAGQYAVDFLRAAEIRCRVDFPDQVPPRELMADARHGLFLVLKEALNNVVKHASASEVWIRAQLAEDTLRLSIEDNGHGFTPREENPLDDGLRNMQQRLAELGGDCRVASVPDQGTRVTIVLPLPVAERKPAAAPPWKS